MGIKDRPYVGTWKENAKTVVRYTPDALVFLNGDTGLRTETLQHKRIDIQPYITQVSCDHGTQPGTASASISLSLPATLGSAIFREGNSLLRVGLEVHIYLRGYYEVAGAVQLDKGQHDYEEVMKNLPITPNSPEENKRLGEASFVRPYYHAFHGVVTNFSYDYASGFYNAGLECTGMLHFWQYMDMSTNASLFGARPTGSQLQMSLVGHNFTGDSPFAVIWKLYRDSAGAAGGVAFALSSSTNVQAPTRTGETTLFHQTQRYWERRFLQGMYRLRMFGANGAMFNTSTQAMLGRMSSAQIQAAISSDRITAATTTGALNEGNDPMRFWDGTGRGNGQQASQSRQYIMERIGGTATPNLAIESDEILMARRLSERSSMGLAVEQLQAYVNDISMYGQVNLFESSYESKLDIAIAAANAAGYEFYQDVDGDLVFKPPLFNMDTKPLTAYNVQPHEVISISYKEAEPACTYFIMKAEAFRNMNGLGLSGEWGVRGSFIDYKLVAQYGWRPGNWECALYSDGRSAFWGAVGKMAVQNKGMFSATLTIPLRPELRCGFPIYIKHIDTYYYIDNMSHSFQFGAQCTTTLQLVARRQKFLPPGNLAAINQEGEGDLAGNLHEVVSLGNPNREPIPIRVPVVDSNNKVTAIEPMGYPNVVMALDMNNINPLAAQIGLDAFDLTNRYTLNTLLWHLVRNNLMSLPNGDGVDLSNPETWRDVTWAQGATALVDGTPTQFSGVTIDVADLYNQIDDFAAERNEVQDAIAAALENGNEVSTEIQERASELRRNLIERWTQQYAADSSTPETTIFDVMAVVMHSMNPRTQEQQQSDFRNQSSASILNILGDRKATFTNASTPGYYRYYSSAAPEAADQAPAAFTYTPRSTVNGSIVPRQEDESNVQADSSRNQRLAFRRQASSLDFSALTTNSKQLAQLKRGMLEVDTNPGPCRGFRIVKGRRDPNNPILPTHHIHKLEFCKTPLAYNMLTPRDRRIPAYTSSGLAAKIKEHIERFMLDATGATTLEEAVKPFWEGLAAIQNGEAANINPWAGPSPAAAERSDEHSNFFGKAFTDEMQALYRVRDSNATGRRRQFPGSMLTLNRGDVPEFESYGAKRQAAAGPSPDPANPQPQATVFFAGGVFDDGDDNFRNRATLGTGISLDRVFKATWSGNVISGYTRKIVRAGGLTVAGNVASLLPTDFGKTLANSDLGKVPLNVLPLVCNAFATNGNCWDKAANGNNWPDITDTASYDVAHAKVDGIKSLLAERMASRLEVRIQELLGQWRAMFYHYFPAKGRGSNHPLKSTNAIRAYMAFNDIVDAINGAFGTDITIDTSSNGMYRSAISGINKTYVVTPVIPVSDAGGYEVVGNYAYGRGVDVAPNVEDGQRPSFQQLMEQDPVNYLGTFENQAGERVAEQLVEFAEGLMQRSQSSDMRYRRLAELAISIQTSLPSAELRAFMQHPHIAIDWERWQQLNTIDRNALANGTQPDPSQVLETLGASGNQNPVLIDARTQVLMQQLMNSFTHGTVAPAAQNTAYTLADLTPFNVDSASAQDWVPHDAVYNDALVNLPAYDASAFVTVVSGETESGWSPVEDYIRELMNNKAIDWALSQQALRGQREIPYVSPSAEDLLNMFKPYQDMFGENAGDWWGNQFNAVADVRAEDGEEGGLWADVTDIWDGPWPWSEEASDE